MSKRLLTQLMGVRRMSRRHILVGLCGLVSLLLIVGLQAVYTGSLPCVVAIWNGPPPNMANRLTNPFQLPAFRGQRSRVHDILTSIPPGSQLGVLKGLNNDENNYKYYTEAKLRQLTACMARGDCHSNAENVVIFAAYHCHLSVFKGYIGGEGVWCNGMIESLERQGYTVLLAKDDWRYVAHIYRQIPELVKAIIGDDSPGSRYGRPRDFFRSEARPDGFPTWKYFRFYYFSTPKGTVISSYWCASAEIEWRQVGMGNYRNNTYLGYALELPEETRTVPWSQRPNRAYILGKRVQYFYKWRAEPFIPAEFITRAYHDMRKEIPDFEFVGGFIDDRTPEEKEKLGEWKVPEGVRQLGKLNASEFDDAVANSKAMVGIGWPATSPSPYRAIARGVPFLNPHILGEHSTADKPETWMSVQHDSMRYEQPPHVYHVEARNYESFFTALRTAMTTPAEPYILPRLRRDAFDERMRNFVHRDWRSEAERILTNRKNGQESELGVDLGMFEL
ncbi:uncharacterized protein CcaverHIS019_0400310 [Cutaneotrichosporon cavernicola]|uniref:alpha-1,6-mannosyl-glycoprotein 6-beta-N-acetylglucosaminyltransferase n=1 Tax=Cutaneotrichosporon cavernicola TaxID=279322 RepID=A0AA48L3C5_9TREE|nr:uncharacterized protein CcaverHIS019_0400310 [Cutaneotrichosporon cavernicola]BEI91211.1 hypothetical protein CcaverHIS019_0400310 [Cutaneotrichosporon cavernicola]BEI98984.1 hypothetical protein CcaverHIS631_0400270 [Cutaneotrichosporon cavernicola]